MFHFRSHIKPDTGKIYDRDVIPKWEKTTAENSGNVYSGIVPQKDHFIAVQDKIGLFELTDAGIQFPDFIDTLGKMARAAVSEVITVD